VRYGCTDSPTERMLQLVPPFTPDEA
jgi:hypothetical protein